MVKKEKNNPINLLVEVNRLLRSKIKEKMDLIGLPFAYRPFMFHLGEKDGISQVELVNLTKFKAPTVSLTIKNMINDGLVEVKTKKDDNRVNLIYLTKKGLDTNLIIEKTFLDFNAHIAECLNEEEKEILENLLNKIKDYTKTLGDKNENSI